MQALESIFMFFEQGLNPWEVADNAADKVEEETSYSVRAFTWKAGLRETIPN